MKYTVYRKDSGLFTGRTLLASSDKILALNLAEGEGAIEGVFDHLSQRVDTASGKVVDYQSPQPSTDHEWDAGTKRWKLTAAATAKQQAHDQALVKIQQLEAAQPRAVRDFILSGDNSRIKAIEDQIATLRKQL